jgi:hypothetical protein
MNPEALNVKILNPPQGSFCVFPMPCFFHSFFIKINLIAQASRKNIKERYLSVIKIDSHLYNCFIY